MIKLSLLTMIFTMINAFSAPARAVESPYNFQGWKDQQVLEAQNQVLRISARISQLKTSRPGYLAGKETLAPLPVSTRIKKSEIDPLLAGERDLRRAQETLQAANQLTLNEYLDVYLSSLHDRPEALQALAQKLTKEELAEIFKGLLSKSFPTPTPSDAKRNNSNMGAGVEPLTVTSQAKTP